MEFFNNPEVVPYINSKKKINYTVNPVRGDILITPGVNPGFENNKTNMRHRKDKIELPRFGPET
jgi:hypothetical protein